MTKIISAPFDPDVCFLSGCNNKATHGRLLGMTTALVCTAHAQEGDELLEEGGDNGRIDTIAPNMLE